MVNASESIDWMFVCNVGWTDAQRVTEGLMPRLAVPPSRHQGAALLPLGGAPKGGAMNYGYEPTDGKDGELASRLIELVAGYRSKATGGGGPYVETDGMYKGVRIRRLTHLPEDVLNELVDKADAIYVQVTKGEEG